MGKNNRKTKSNAKIREIKKVNVEKKQKEQKKDKIPRSVFCFYCLWFIFLIVIDQFTKYFALRINSLDFGWFAFDLVKNTGASWGLLKGSNFLLIWLSIIVLGLLIYFHEQFPKPIFVLITAGLIGNLIDRIVYGYVIDFINFKFWPVFNIADSLISIGIILAIVFWIRKEFF